jgi:hypothetical protein
MEPGKIELVKNYRAGPVMKQFFLRGAITIDFIQSWVSWVLLNIFPNLPFLFSG